MSEQLESTASQIEPPPIPAIIKKYQWLAHLAILVLAIAVVSAAGLLQIDQPRRVSVFNLPIPELCTFHRLTGWDCPGCGMTRSFISMAHGRIMEAIGYHLLGVAFFLFCVVQIPLQTGQLIRVRQGREPWQFRRIQRVLLPVVVVSVTLFVVYRIGSQVVNRMME